MDKVKANIAMILSKSQLIKCLISTCKKWPFSPTYPWALLIVTHALVTSRLDYCNAPIHGFGLEEYLEVSSDIQAVTVIPLLHELHWFLVCFGALQDASCHL